MLIAPAGHAAAHAPHPAHPFFTEAARFFPTLILP